MKVVKSATRLFVILARKAPLGVIFRRGPSNHVLLIKWHLEQDTFEFGQWFKGRIYERRCDLSPEGDLLLYFAANWRKPFQSWTAVSRPPYLTALALWPKGDGWGGGGQFTARDFIQLNHRDEEMSLADGFSVPKWMSIGRFGFRSGWGEDNPVWSERLLRDGWKLENPGGEVKPDFDAKIVWQFDPPITWRKAHPQQAAQLSLQMSITGIHERNGPWYLTEHSITRENGNNESLGMTEWADWSPEGDLLFSRSGCLFRLVFENGSLGPVESSRQIADFSALAFEANKSPDEVHRWPSAIESAE